MAEQGDPKNSLTWGEISEPPNFEGDTIDQLSEWTRNSIISIISSGDKVDDRIQQYLNITYGKAAEIDQNVGSFGNWVNTVLPNEVDKKKELSLFETLDTNLNETDGTHVQEFKKSIDDPSYVYKISPDLVAAQDKFNSLKRKALEKDRDSEADPNNSPSLPFVSTTDEFGQDTVLLQGSDQLKANYKSLEEAIKESLDRGSLKPRDLIGLSSRLKFAEGTEKTYSDLKREFNLTIKVHEYTNTIRDEADRIEEQVGIRAAPDDLGDDEDLIKSLNALALDIRLDHQNLVDSTDTVDPEARYMYERLPALGALAAASYGTWNYATQKIGRIVSPKPSVLSSRMPLTELHEGLDSSLKNLSEDDISFIKNKSAMADRFREKFQITNLSDDQVIEAVKKSLHANLHSTGMLPYIKDEKNLFLNIKKKENHGLTIHPTLLGTPKDIFEKAIKQHPNLTKKEIESLRFARKQIFKDRFNYLQGLIFSDSAVRKKWIEFQKENYKVISKYGDLSDISDKKRRELQSKVKDNYTLVEEFLSNKENYSYLKDVSKSFLFSAVSSLPMIYHSVVGALGSESSTNKALEIQLKKQRGKELSAAFGEGGFLLDVANVGGDLVIDLGLTFGMAGPATSTARNVATRIATKKLAAEGYKVTKIKGTSNALYSAFFAKDTALKKQLAADLLKKGAITPLKTKAYSDDIIKVLADDLEALALNKTEKLTRLGALGFSVGAPSGLRSASYAYTTYMDSLPDSLSFDEKRQKAIPLALLRGGITAAITVGASYLGRGGAEAFATKKASKMMELRGYKPTKNALENLAKMSRATDKAGKSLLVPEVAEIVATIARNGLRKSILFGLGAKTVLTDLARVGIDEGIEEGLDEFIGSYVDEYATGDKTTLGDKLGAAAYAGLLGLSMGVGVGGTAKFTGAVAGKLGLSDTTESTERAYGQLVDMVMDQASTLNEAATNARNSQAPLTAEVLEQNRNQLLAGVAKDPVKPASSFRMSVTRDTNISEDRDASEIVTVNAENVSGVSETTNEKGETIYAVEYSPEDASGEVFTAYTKDASVTRLDVRTRENYKVEQDIIQEIKKEVLIPNVADQNEALRTAEGVEAATNNFIRKHKVALKNNNITVLIDPTEEQQEGFIDLVRENEAYQALQGAESSVHINSEGEVFIIINTANTSEVTNSIPKQRRTTYMQSVFTEALASSFELVSARDKYFNLDPEVRGDLSLEEFIDTDRLIMYSEMSQYERDWAASLILGEDVEEGLADKVSDKSLIAATHIKSLLQLDMSGQVKGVQKTAWAGKSRGGALSKNVKQKLFDILSYLRAAIRTTTETASRAFLRRHITYISDNLTKPFFDAVSNLSDADQARAIDEASQQEDVRPDQVVVSIEGSPLVGSLPQDSLETVPEVIESSILPEGQVAGLDFDAVEQPPESDTVIGRNADGDLIVLQSMTLAEAEIHLSNLEKLEGQFIEQSTPEKIFISPNATPSTDANTQVILQTRVRSQAFSLSSVQGSPDSPSLRQAILENPLFSRNMVENSLEGDNVVYKIAEDPDNPSALNLYALPKVLRFTRELTPADIDAIKTSNVAGIDPRKLSEGTTLEIAKNVLDRALEHDPSFSEEARAEMDLNTELSTETASEDHIEPVQQTSVDGTGSDTQDPPKANNKQKEKQLKIAKKIYSSLQRRLLREGTRFYEGSRESGAVSWYDRAKLAVGINPKQIEELLKSNTPVATKAIMNLAVDEELIHQISWETLTYGERKKAIEELLSADRRGANALIMMVQEYNTDIKGYTTDETIQILRLGLPETDSLPAGVEDTPANRALKDDIAEYIFEELIRKHVSLVNGRGATETDYDFLQQEENQGVLSVYKKYIENFFIGRLRAKKALRKDSKLGPYYATAVAKVAQEFKAAKEGFRRRPNHDKLDLDIDLGVYSKQSTLIGADISTVAPEDEQREEWLSEIDPEEVKASVVKGKTVGTRSPSAKGKKGEGVDPDKVVTLKDLRENPEAYKKNALILLNYPLVAREFKDNPLLEKIRKAKAPLNKIELKKQQLRQDIKSAKDRLKSDLITYKANEISDSLKPQRKQEADALKKKYSDSQAAVKKIEGEVNKLNNSLKRANKRFRETVSKENKKVNALIKKAQAAGNEADLKILQQRKADIKNILSNNSETAELISGIKDALVEARQRLTAIKKLSKANKSAFEKALKEFSKPTVKKTSIKMSMAQAINEVEQLESDLEEGVPVRVGAKALVVKLNAIIAKEVSLLTAIDRAKENTTKFGDALKKLSKSKRAFPIEVADEIYSSLNNVAQQNLSLLIKLFPQDLRVYASLWYDGANIIANKFAKTFDVSVEQAAAVLAVFSPQKDWYMNVALAERTLHIFKSRQAALFDGSMVSNFMRRAGEPELKYDKNGNPFYEGDALPVYDEDGNHVTDENGVLQFDNWGSTNAKDKFEISKKILNLGLAGKRFNELEAISFKHKGKQKTFSKEALQARFIRMFSEATENVALRDPKTFNVIRPDGEILERPSMSSKGVPRSIAWGSYVTIEKAINVLNANQDNMMDVISNELGLMHKVRSFYNNISDPSSTAGHVTMDTHAIAALLLKPVSGNSLEVTQNFGGKGTASDSNLGISGLYPAFAEAYRAVSFTNDDNGQEYLTREIQSITWEAIRLLFPSKWKANKNNVRAIEELHTQYEEGLIDLEQLQQQIYSFVQTSQAEGMPADEALSINEGIESANTVRGLGVGRPDWGQASPVSVKAPPSDQEQFTTIRWRNLETRHTELAGLEPKEQIARREEIADLFREASRKAEEKIPAYFSYEDPVGLYTDITEEKYIYKNPKGSDLDRDADQKDYKQFILTPANKYMFSPNMSPREAILALGLREYLIVTEATDRLDPDQIVIYVNKGTTQPYNKTGAGVEVVKSFYGDETEVLFDIEKQMGVPIKKKDQLGNRARIDRFLYDGSYRRPDRRPIPLSVRFAPFTEVKYKPQEVEDPIELHNISDRTLTDPYDKDLREAYFSPKFVIPIKKNLVTNIEGILNTVINFRNAEGQESPYVPMARFLLEVMSDEMLRWRVYNDPSRKRSTSSPNPSTGIMLARNTTMRVDKDYPNAEKSHDVVNKISVMEWLLGRKYWTGKPIGNRKFDSPLAVILKWGGIRKGLQEINSIHYRDFDYIPDVSDFGKYNYLSPEDKSILNDWIRWNVHNREVGHTIFDSRGETDLDELSQTIDINLRTNPDLEKYLEDPKFIKLFISNDPFFSTTKSGRSFSADRYVYGKTIYVVNGVPPATVMHEIFHALTQREFDKHVTTGVKKEKGLKLYNLYKQKSDDPLVPKPIRELLRVYLKAVDYGDKYLSYRPTAKRKVTPTASSKNITKLMSTNPDKAGRRAFYGLANIDEFVTMSMTSPEFQAWLMAIPDIEATKDGEPKSLWDKFVELITDLLNNVKGDPDFVQDSEVEEGATLLTSAIKAVMEVASNSGNINRNLALLGYDMVSEWQMTKGIKAGKAEAEVLKRGKEEEFIEKHGLNLPPVNRKILDEVYRYEAKEAAGTQNAMTVETYKRIIPFIENKAFSKTLGEFMAKYNVVDWGSGMGRGTEALKEGVKSAVDDRVITLIRDGQIKVESYEPYFVEGKGRTAPSLKRKPRKESQDLVISSAVINVLPADERAQLLDDIYTSLKEEGQAIITARTPAQIVKGIKEENLKVVGPAEYISSVGGKATTFQKGFSSQSLKKFIQEVLPYADVTTTGLDISPIYAIITKPTPAGATFEPDPAEQFTKIKGQTPLDPETDARYLELAKDPKKNEKALLEMVARRAEELGLEAYQHSTRGDAYGITSFVPRISETDSTLWGHYTAPLAPVTGGRLMWYYVDTKEIFDPENPAHIKRLEDADEATHEAFGIGLLTDLREGGTVHDKYRDDGRIKIPYQTMGSYTQKALKNLGFEGHYEWESPYSDSDKFRTLVSYYAHKVKLANPITRDNKGNVIPLSQRFREDTPDIRGWGEELQQFTKIRGDESFSEMNAAKQAATHKVTEELSAVFDIDVERIFTLLGPKMYNSKLSTIIYKESIQNSYDALKDLQSQNPTVWTDTKSQPQIEYGLWEQAHELQKKKIRGADYSVEDWEWGKRIRKEGRDVAPHPELVTSLIESLKKGEDPSNKQWVYIRDNGIGMSPEIIKSAFFTLGGSHKQSKNSSGGFGLAKISMFRAAQEMFIQTVRDGIESTVRVDNETLTGQKPFNIKSREVDAPSGTQIWMKFPTEVEGRDFYAYPDGDEHTKIIDDTRKILIIRNGTPLNTKTFSEIEAGGFEKTTLSTPHADVDIYAYEVGQFNDKGETISDIAYDESPIGQRINNKRIEYYSNGLYQFREYTPLVSEEFVPYNFKVNIKPKVEADSMNYPFHNNREEFSPQWTGKDPSDDKHPVELEVKRVATEYGLAYFKQKFKEEFSIIKGIDGNSPKPSVPIVYNNLDFDLTPPEADLMSGFAEIVHDIADQFLEVYQYDYRENNNSLSSNHDVRLAIRNHEKVDAENDSNFKGLSYHYGSALSKNWGGVNTGINPRVILVNPVYGSLNFTKDGDLNKEVGVGGLAAYLTDIILHEVNHIGQRTEGAGFTYPFSAVRAYHSRMNPIFNESNYRIQNLISKHYESIKTLRQKYVKGSTKFLNAELQGNKFIDSVSEFNDVRSGKVRSQREAIEQNFGKGVSEDEVQITNGGITVLEAISGRTFRADEVNDDPSVQYTQIGVQPTTDWALYAGKQVGGLYISSDAIDNGFSVLEKPANKEKKKVFEDAKTRLETYLEEERIQAELDGEVYVPFSYDVVSIEKDQVRFVLMSDLTEAHPHVVESLRVPINPDQPVQQGRIPKNPSNRQVYHRMDLILGFKHPLYKYHKTITDLEEALGLLNLKDADGKKVNPSGYREIWKQQVESTGYRWDSLQEEHRKIKEKFFGGPQDTLIGQEDATQTPEYIESSEAWDTLIDILRADIKVLEEDPDDIMGPVPNPIKFLQRKVYGKDAEIGWRKGGQLWSLFYGPYERTLRKYLNKSNFFRKTIQDVVLSYKSTTDRLLKEVYTDNGLDIPSQTIFEATGTTQFSPSEEVAQRIQDRYLDKIDEINKDSSLEGDEKKEALLEAYNERQAEKQQAAHDVLKAARKRKSEALERLRQDSPELAKHIISLRKLADSISSEIGSMVSLAAPNLQLRIDERLDIYLTTQYRAFTRPNWTEEFLELDIHREARDVALDYFANEYVKTQTEHLVREGGLDKETAEAQARDNLINKPELKMMALENFLRAYDKDFGVDSLKRKGNLPPALRGALGEFSEETNMDVLYRTLLNLGTLVSKMSLRDKLVSQGIKSGWLVTQEKAALERKRAEEAGRPDPYEDYVEVVKSKDSSISEELAGSLDDTGVKIKGEGFEVKLNPDGTVKEAPRSKPPSADPLINYRVKTEDGSVEKKGNLLARPDVKQAIIKVLNPKQGMGTPENEYVQIALKLFGGIEKSVAGLTGLGMMSKTLGSIPFYERQVLGSFLFLSQNGIPISGYIPELGREVGRSVFPSGVFKKRSYLEGRSADRGDMVYYASLKSMGVLDEGIVYSILKDLLSGNISKEDVELEIDHLKHPTKSILKNSKLFPEGSTSEKALRKAAELLKSAGKVKDIPIGKAQALALALDNAIKVQAYEYERSWLLDAREDSQSADRGDEYRDLSNAELDEMAAQIVLRTQQSRSQSAPIVEFFNLPIVRILTAPFARFLAENPRLLVNIMRQSSAEMNSSNPVIKERGNQRNKGFLFTNFVLYMALPLFLQRFIAGLSDDDERVLRKSAPEFSRFQNLFYLKNEEGQIGTMSLSYVHPMSPILDFAMRGFEHTMRGDIKEAIETVTVGYLTDTFLNDQIFWAAISDVKNNTNRDTGQPIVGEYTPDALKIKLSYIFEKGLAPPTLLALSKSVGAIGADYPKDEDARTFAGHPIYSPKGQILRHLAPVKYYPLQLESLARRRFREIYENMYTDLRVKNRLRRGEEGFKSKKIDKMVRNEHKALSDALKDARLAYNVYTNLLGSEGVVQDVMRGARFKKSLIDIVASGYLRGEDLLIEGESLMNNLREQGLDARSNQLYQSYLKLIDEQPMIPLD